ncbi:hypothetical protein CAPTEDRAFT_216168 [Capitella teleta]|uniref:G-protein coupled receptors family 1 profile domain-containing protein n=1 Tax=Capitella teleta TaxID=283909 RepID=R7V2K0_CAPTE|nr:hypothetical protein CAPTEDRAFT_216168 [Capitella teleta]|eukprot:ELU13083.1 hypothetical protein CAPTEDRAFT_216168 [Capitella teleta]
MEATEQTAMSKPNEGNCDAYNLWFRVIFGGFVMTLGLIGNILTIIIMRKQKTKTTTMLALTYLAIADFCVLIIYGTINLSPAITDLANNADLAYNMKIIISRCVMPISQSFNLVSVYITVIVIWQRYVGVCLPTKAKTYVSMRIVNVQVVCVVIGAVLLYLPSFCASLLFPEMMHFDLRSTATHAGFTIFYDLILSYTISYIIPIVSLVTMSFGLVRGLRNMKFQGDNKQKTKKEMTFSLVVIVIVVVICQSFAPIRRVLRWKYPSYNMAIRCGGDLFYFGPTEIIFILINSSCNFFILVVCARGFRGKLLALVKRSSAVGAAIDGTNGSSGTRTTAVVDA